MTSFRTPLRNTGWATQYLSHVWPFIATQLNWTQLTQLHSLQPSQSCFCLWCHDLQTESTVVHAVTVSTTWRRVELSWVVSLWTPLFGVIHCESYNLQAGPKSPLTRAKRPQSGAKRPGGETSWRRNAQVAKRPGGETFSEWTKRPGGGAKRQRGETSINLTNLFSRLSTVRECDRRTDSILAARTAPLQWHLLQFFFLLKRFRLNY